MEAEGAEAGRGQDGVAGPKVGEFISEKYCVTGVLGAGGFATTYEAECQEGSETRKVAVKALALRSLKAWKELELFEREARVLRSLKHPGIPEYLDSFEVDTPSDRVYYIVQRIAPGKSLQALVDSGWRASEDEIREIALEVLDILQYLESCRPPVVHRDIKPGNIILDVDRPRGDKHRLQLVDFGAVQEAAAVPTTGVSSTVVGTFGYMAPEQFQNRSSSLSDLYAFGATLLFVLSGRPPSAFPQTRLRVDFRPFVSMSERMVRVIERLLEPAPEDRFQSAAEVARVLRETDEAPALISGTQSAGRGVVRGTAFPQAKAINSARPAGTKVNLERSSDKQQLRIRVPPGGLSSANTTSGTFAVAWNAFVAFWMATAVTGGAPLLFTLFSAPFWAVGFQLAKGAVGDIAVSTDLDFDLARDEFSLVWRAGGLWSHSVQGRCSDISSVGLPVVKEQNGQLIRSCVVNEGVRKHFFGGGLEESEREWIASEMSGFLSVPLGAALPQLRERAARSSAWDDRDDTDGF